MMRLAAGRVAMLLGLCDDALTGGAHEASRKSAAQLTKSRSILTTQAVVA